MKGQETSIDVSTEGDESKRTQELKYTIHVKRIDHGVPSPSPLPSQIHEGYLYIERRREGNEEVKAARNEGNKTDQITES